MHSSPASISLQLHPSRRGPIVRTSAEIAGHESVASLSLNHTDGKLLIAPHAEGKAAHLASITHALTEQGIVHSNAADYIATAGDALPAVLSALKLDAIAPAFNQRAELDAIDADASRRQMSGATRR